MQHGTLGGAALSGGTRKVPCRTSGRTSVAFPASCHSREPEPRHAADPKPACPDGVIFPRRLGVSVRHGHDRSTLANGRSGAPIYYGERVPEAAVSSCSKVRLQNTHRIILSVRTRSDGGMGKISAFSAAWARRVEVTRDTFPQMRSSRRRREWERDSERARSSI
jgi:hypothetical protein